jgi:hypothetical protein
MRLMSFRSGARVSRVLGVLAVLAIGAGAGGREMHALQMQQPTLPQQQQNGSQSVPAQLPGLGMNRPSNDPTREHMEALRLKALNDARHKKMLDETAKLLQLSTELKADVEKAGKDELSVEVVKKAADIEKLAHDVKEQMRQ